MPFTLAHPAAVLPLMRRPLVGLALVCGAMAPDIPYYVRSTPLQVTAESWYEPFTNATTSHSMAGLLPVTVPLALVLYLMLLAATPPVVWLARGRWDVDTLLSVGAAPDRTVGAVRRRWARWAWVPVSLLIGALTHLAWDSFTSGDGFLAERLGAMNGTALADLTWVRLMQHVSTVVGLTVLTFAVWRRRRAIVNYDEASLRGAFWVLGGLVAVGLVAGVASALATFDRSASPSTRDLVENALASAMMGGGAAVGVVIALATACWWLALLCARRWSGPQRA